MLFLLIFILSTIGATLIVTQSYAFKNVRDKAQKINKNLGKLMRCSQCVGFWMGCIIKSILLIYISKFFIISLLIIPIYGFIGSFFSYLSYLLIKPLMDKYD